MRQNGGVRAVVVLLFLCRVAGADVLDRYCARCHDVESFVGEGLIVAGDPDGSLAFRRALAGEMPPKNVKARPSREELDELRRWIEELEPTRPRAARRAASVDDEHTRWLSVAKGEEAALAKVLNSLSWSPVLRPIVVEEGLARIDLREFGWSQAQWDAVAAAYPYGLAGDEAIRADWFIATASRPLLYDVLLGLPATEAELVARLGVDRTAVRAGFTNSGVSAHNRVIERRAARHGAYWRSYDFSSSTGDEDVFAHPLDFVAAGGEIIFTLPNGLQGYMLVDAAGRKLDKAPTTIVTDARRPDRAVVNGLSCMSCHASGIIAKEDQIAVAVALDEVRELYRAELTTLMKLDAARFERALAELGVDGEPVADAVARYEAPLDRRRAEAEVGKKLGKGVVPSLDAKRGTVKREVWEQEFGRVALEVGAGIPAKPSRSGDDTRVWIDAGGRSWLVAAQGLTQRRARELCAERRLELPTSAELAAAIASGLGGVASGTFWTRGTRLDAHNQRRAEVHESPSGTARLVRANDRHDVLCVTASGASSATADP